MDNNENFAPAVSFVLPVSAAGGLSASALSAALVTPYSGLVSVRLSADSLVVWADVARLTLLGGGVPDAAGVAAYVAAMLRPL